MQPIHDPSSSTTSQFRTLESSPAAEETLVKRRHKFTRSKTGCKTCRVKKVKCDERHPVCKRCERHGLECSWPDVIQDKIDAHTRKSMTFHEFPFAPRADSRSPVGMGLQPRTTKKPSSSHSVRSDATEASPKKTGHSELAIHLQPTPDRMSCPQKDPSQSARASTSFGIHDSTTNMRQYHTTSAPALPYPLSTQIAYGVPYTAQSYQAPQFESARTNVNYHYQNGGYANSYADQNPTFSRYYSPGASSNGSFY